MVEHVLRGRLHLRTGRGSRELLHLLSTKGGRWLAIAVGAIAVLTVAGLFALWPFGWHAPGSGSASRTVPGEVVRVVAAPCAPGQSDECRTIDARVGSRTVTIALGPTRNAPAVGTGDAVRLMRLSGSTAAPEAGRAARYEFVEVDRRSSLGWLGLIAALFAVALLRWRGVLAVLGVGLSVTVVVLFMVPAILAGKPALLVALVASLVVMFITLVLTNGIGAQMLAAALGVTATLVLTCLLAALAVWFTDLDGTTDLAVLGFTARADSLSLRGIILAGMLIGALGVVADTAVTQASAVMALRRANPRLDARRLYREAFVIGRDHLSATIHTLVLAYTGAALPLLLTLHLGKVSELDAINSQTIAEPIVATIVGCLALIAAVPFTTGLSSVIIARVPADALPDHHHAH
jgi:uncharacterized membrane protein